MAMTESEKVKDRAENLLIKIIEYLDSAEPDDEERNNRFGELATSLITATLNFDKDFDDLVKDINDICNDCRIMALAGAFRYKHGDESRVKKIFILEDTQE